MRKLKRRFNEEFDILYNIKQDRMIQINGWRNTLKTVLSELGDSTIEEMEELENKLQWTPKENPELDLPTLQGFHLKKIILLYIPITFFLKLKYHITSCTG